MGADLFGRIMLRSFPVFIALYHRNIIALIPLGKTHDFIKNYLKLRDPANINPEEFQRRFAEWIRAAAKIAKGQVIAIDGKTLRSVV
ncbi:MAG: hypothetical protein D3924_01255 [Candidatus Electrothrix sp. AR4]|nr:hypothetical protein [Candidatus Electrothrix sp. AR4]